MQAGLKKYVTLKWLPCVRALWLDNKARFNAFDLFWLGGSHLAAWSSHIQSRSWQKKKPHLMADESVRYNSKWRSYNTMFIWTDNEWLFFCPFWRQAVLTVSNPELNQEKRLFYYICSLGTKINYCNLSNASKWRKRLVGFNASSIFRSSISFRRMTIIFN